MLPDDLGAVRAVIAPHAGYIYSGRTAGYAFKALATFPKKQWTVYLLGPAHRVPFHGVALGEFSAFRTPLGAAAVATDRVDEMLARSPLYTRAPLAHMPEHCLEVEIPFLQSVLPDLRLVPMLFGEVDPKDVGQELSDHIGPDDLIVVSNDLSHFFSYDQARQLDNSLLDAVLAGDTAGVLRGEACGRAPVVALMTIARHKGWKAQLLDYRTSGDTAGDRRQVVGYAAIAYTE
jgi:AmmeMemoRadiSam system protein B